MATIHDALWQNVERAGRAMVTDTGPYAWGEDDAGMIDAAADDLLAWADDCADRLGASEGEFRAALLTFIAYRDDGAGLDGVDYAAALQEAHDIAESDDEAAVSVRIRIQSWYDMERGIYARDPARRDAVDAWAAALEYVGGDA